MQILFISIFVVGFLWYKWHQYNKKKTHRKIPTVLYEKEEEIHRSLKELTPEEQISMSYAMPETHHCIMPSGIPAQTHPHIDLIRHKERESAFIADLVDRKVKNLNIDEVLKILDENATHTIQSLESRIFDDIPKGWEVAQEDDGNVKRIVAKPRKRKKREKYYYNPFQT